MPRQLQIVSETHSSFFLSNLFWLRYPFYKGDSSKNFQESGSAIGPCTWIASSSFFLVSRGNFTDETLPNFFQDCRLSGRHGFVYAQDSLSHQKARWL